MDLEETKKQLEKLYSESEKENFIEAIKLLLVSKLDQRTIVEFIAAILISEQLKQELNELKQESSSPYTDDLFDPNPHVENTRVAAFAEISEQFRQTPNNSDDIVNSNIVPINRARNKTPTPPKAKS